MQHCPKQHSFRLEPQNIRQYISDVLTPGSHRAAIGVEFVLLLNLRSETIRPMGTRTSRAIITLVLLICVVCPVLEMFDQWDHTLQTGNDTEYSFVILGLCVGASFAFARAVLRMVGLLRSKRVAGTDGFLHIFSRSSFDLIVKASLSASPPLTTLRI
jgi:hypothetical protein